MKFDVSILLALTIPAIFLLLFWKLRKLGKDAFKDTVDSYARIIPLVAKTAVKLKAERTKKQAGEIKELKKEVELQQQ
jgi:hypothetical protein